MFKRVHQETKEIKHTYQTGFYAGNTKITPVLSDLVTHSFCELQPPAAVNHQN